MRSCSFVREGHTAGTDSFKLFSALPYSSGEEKRVIGCKKVKAFMKKIMSASGDGLWSTPITFVNTLVVAEPEEDLWKSTCSALKPTSFYL